MPRCRNNQNKQVLHSAESADRRFAAAVDRLLRTLARVPVLPAQAGEECSEADAWERLRALAALADSAAPARSPSPVTPRG